MAKPLTAKVALVTGGSRGIGAAIAKRLAHDGAAVAITYASAQQKADEVVDAITAAGGQALALRADSADVAAVKSAVVETVRALVASMCWSIMRGLPLSHRLRNSPSTISTAWWL